MGEKLGEGQVATVYHDVLELEDVGMAALCPVSGCDKGEGSQPCIGLPDSRSRYVLIPTGLWRRHVCSGG